MAQQAQNMQLSNFDKKKLADAYMNLYNALVVQYQSDNMSFGESWYHAMREMKNILKQHKNTTPDIASEYLMDFYRAHSKTQSKQMMTSPDKDKHVHDTGHNLAVQRVKRALGEFETAISTISVPQVLTIITIQSHSTPYKETFYDWAGINLTDGQLDSLDNNPEEFARQYRKFILSKKVKEK